MGSSWTGSRQRAESHALRLSCVMLVEESLNHEQAPEKVLQVDGFFAELQ